MGGVGIRGIFNAGAGGRGGERGGEGSGSGDIGESHSEYQKTEENDFPNPSTQNNTPRVKK
jgi:hypothetical protein